MQCDGLANDIYSDYVLGTLAGPDLSELASHLDRDCTRCKSEISLTRKVWTGVAIAAPAIEPRRALRARVIASVQDPERAGFRLSWWQPIAGLAALALAVFTGTQISYKAPQPVVQSLPAGQALSAVIAENRALRDQLANTKAPVPAPAQIVITSPPQDNSRILAQAAESKRQVAQAEQDLARQKELLAAAQRERDDLNRKYQAILSQPRPDDSATQRQLAAAQLRAQQLEHDVTEYKALLVKARERSALPQTASLLADPNLRLVRLRSTSKELAVEGHALVASGSEVVFYGSELPALPPGRAYQLWLIRGSAPAIVSAGVFRPDAQRKALVKFDSASFTSGITTIAVTDEPETGSLTPTGHKLLIGS